MSIEALRKVAPPPAIPIAPFMGSWGPLELQLRSKLPEDYKSLVRLYGLGSFLDFFFFYLPQSRDRYVRLEAEISVVCKIFANDESLPYPVWPNPGGLLPVGRTDNGDYIFWLTEGEPADWRVVVWDRGLILDACETFDCDLTTFIAGVITGEIRPTAFPEDLLPYEPPFTPLAADPPDDEEPGWPASSAYGPVRLKILTPDGRADSGPTSDDA